MSDIVKPTESECYLGIIKEYQREVERLNNEIKILKQNDVNEVLRDDLVLCTKQYKKSEEKLKKANKKIDRLNNIIDKIEKALKDHKDIKVKAHYNEFYVEIDEMLEYIQELKENK